MDTGVSIKTMFLNVMKIITNKKKGTAIETKIAPPYSILFMSELEGKNLQLFNLKPLAYIYIFYLATRGR